MAVSIARVEEGGDERNSALNEDLCTRTSWVDARLALSHINKGRATGNVESLRMRKRLQDYLYYVGEFSERHAGAILFIALVVVAAGCAATHKSAILVTDIEKLWVEEGGRLEREMEYVTDILGEGSGTTNQILIQTLKQEAHDNILTSSALITHLNILLAAIDVNVEMFDTSWSLNDLCYATSFQYFENPIIDQIFERLTPCSIITPLDCFWEGSKLLGPKYPVRIPGYGRKKWTNLNPLEILEKMKSVEHSGKFFPFSTFSQFMKRTGITSAYQQKPCLDPTDPDCPMTSPNRNTREPPDVGAELTGGCFGFASKFLHWPEELIVGGAQKNSTSHIIKGEALQSIVQLMGSKDLFDYWKNNYKVHNMDWSQQKATAILDAWVHKFSEKVTEETKLRDREMKYFEVHPFSSATLGDLLRRFSQLSVSSIAVAYVIMLLYVCVSLVRVTKVSDSSVGLGLSGVLLVAGSVISGLGFCAVIGLPFNAATTQILPFLSLGVGVKGVFLMIHAVAEVHTQIPTKAHANPSQVGEVLKRSGISVVIPASCLACSFFAAAIIPIPALRMFCLQEGIVVLVTLMAMMVVFPAIITLDLRRRRAGRVDIFCCFPLDDSPPSVQYLAKETKHSSKTTSVCSSQKDNVKRTAVTRALSPPGRGTVTQVLCPTSSPQECWVGVGNLQVPCPSLESLTSESTRDLVDGPDQAQKWWEVVADCYGCSFNNWVRDFYAPALNKRGVKAVSMTLLFVTLAASAFGVSRLKEGLSLTDIVPQGTPEASFLDAQSKYFGFYNMFAVTQGNFEYPTNQELLYEYHESFNRIPWIIKNDDGGLPDSWLLLFRNWLLGLQKAFDADWKKNYITEEGWTNEASDEGILAYKLLVQTGHIDHPVDRSLVTHVRLVDSNGIINPKAFYNYLTAWVTNDALAYRASQADLRPQPRMWLHERTDFDLKIPKSSPLVYAQSAFFLNHLEETETITQMIEEVRAICKKFEERGLLNFPRGVPFTFWEQYINLRFFLLLALAAVLGAVFLILSLVLFNLWAASLIVLFLAALVLQLAGILGLLGVKLSAAPAVILVVAVGIGVDFTVHFTLGFLTSIGDSNRRTRLALTHMAVPVIHGAISTFLAILMLLCSEFEFIRRYFFYILCALVFLGAIDGLLFLPVLLSLFGPLPDLVSQSSSDRVPLPSPPPSPPPPYHSHGGISSRRSNSSHGHHHHHHYGHHSSSQQQSQRSQSKMTRLYPGLHGSNLSLTTITEEPDSGGSANSSQSKGPPSHEIHVEPRVVVETTTFPGGGSVNGSTSDSADSVQFHEGGHVTTTVTATAKVKVEVHNPYSEPVCRTSAGSDSRRSNRSSNRNSPTNVSVSSSRSSRSSSCSTAGRRSQEFEVSESESQNS